MPIAEVKQGGEGCFRFDSIPTTEQRPVRVWYLAPKNVRANTPVVVVMHDRRRAPKLCRETWRSQAPNMKAIFLFPEFSSRFYRGSRAYEHGGVLDAQGQRTDPAYWSFQAIEGIFDQVKKACRLKAGGYSLYGHGGRRRLRPAPCPQPA